MIANNVEFPYEDWLDYSEMTLKVSFPGQTYVLLFLGAVTRFGVGFFVYAQVADTRELSRRHRRCDAEIARKSATE